jgi:hypothetical protein
MQYIKVSNSGVLDIVKACSMLGASVKNDSTTAIGMFGTGLKYALAQAGRMGIPIRMSSGSDVFETTLKSDEFRGQEFQKVYLRNINTGEEHATPITTNFGQHDWGDLWNIYREIVCNAMDEEGYNLSLVKNLRRSNDRTAIYLPYDEFAKFFNNEKEYFSYTEEDFIKEGTGIVYKKGVRVGKVDGLRLDIQGNVTISESRQMNEWSARWQIANILSYCQDPSVWVEFLKSEGFKKFDIDCSSPLVSRAFNIAVKRVHGKYLICPNVENIIKDVTCMGYYAFVVPSNWTINEDLLPSWKDRMVVPKEVIRSPNRFEQETINWGLECCRKFGMHGNVRIKVFDDDSKALGYAPMKGGEIWLAAIVFRDRRKFLTTLLEEIGHADSGASDYTREFTEYFIGKIADHYISHHG